MLLFSVNDHYETTEGILFYSPDNYENFSKQDKINREITSSIRGEISRANPFPKKIGVPSVRDK